MSLGCDEACQCFDLFILAFYHQICAAAWRTEQIDLDGAVGAAQSQHLQASESIAYIPRQHPYSDLTPKEIRKTSLLDAPA